MTIAELIVAIKIKMKGSEDLLVVEKALKSVTAAAIETRNALQALKGIRQQPVAPSPNLATTANAGSAATPPPLPAGQQADTHVYAQQAHLRNLAQAKQAANQYRETLQRIGGAVNKMLVFVAGLNAALWVTVARAMNAGQALKQFAVSTGLSTDNLQRAQFAAGQFGVAAEDVAGALKNLQKQKALLAIGEGDIQPYALLGLDPLAKPEDTLRRVAKLIRETKEENLGLVREMTSRIGIGDELFASMRRQSAEMDRSLILTKEEIDLLADGKAAWNTLLLTISAFANKLVVALAPALTMVSKAFSRVVVTVTQLTQRFPIFTKVVVVALAAGLVALGAALLGVSAALAVLGINAALATLGMAPFAASVLAATWPLLAATAAVVALYLVLEDLSSWFHGNDSIIGEWVERNFKFDTVENWLKSVSKALDVMGYLSPGGLAESALSSLGRGTMGSTTSNNASVQINVDGSGSPKEVGREVFNRFNDYTKTMVASPAVNR